MYQLSLFGGEEGTVMQIKSNSYGLRRFPRKARIPSLSKEAKTRLSWIEWYYSHKKNKSLTARHFGITRVTLSLWLSRYDPCRPETLEHRSTKPYQLRKPEWTSEAAIAVRELRLKHPRWGKKKLVVLLKRDGWTLSQSTVGRILKHLKATHQIKDPVKRLKFQWRKSNRPWAVRKPKGYGAKRPGDILQVDTVDLRPLPGVVLKQLSVVDVVSRWSGIEVKSRATSRVTRNSMASIMERIPFPVKAIQIDGGSEFMAEFEEFCKERELSLFVLPPHSPKLNGRVERFNRTSREEFHECNDSDVSVSAMNLAARSWEVTYNTIRPHEALGQKTPQEFLNIHYSQMEVKK